MILFVVTRPKSSYISEKTERVIKAKTLLEEYSNDNCLIVHCNQVTPELINRIKPWAICHGGGASRPEHRSPEYLEFIQSTDIPQLGICAAHQFISQCFGSSTSLMRPLNEGEKSPNPKFSIDRVSEAGFCDIELSKPDPLFLGLPKQIKVFQHHKAEISYLGNDMINLAKSEYCYNQVIKHKSKPIYGIQFHPESSTDEYPDGRKIFENFINIAKEYRERV